MSIQHTVTQSWGGQAGLTFSTTQTGDYEANVSQSIPASTTNLLIPFIAVTLANLQSLFIVADGPLTLKGDSSGSPEETITLAANVPLVWTAGCGLANPLTAPLNTGFYATNPSGTTAVNLTIKCLQNN